MNLCLTASQLAHLRAVGLAIDGGQQPTVLDGGFVDLLNTDESGATKNAKRQETGPQAGTRSGRRAWSCGAQASDHSFRSHALEAAYGTDFRILARHYEALAFEDYNGLWVATTSKPLGRGGPEVHFLIAFPIELSLAPRGWAFKEIGKNAKLMSLKHTNFPDASICAYPHGYLPWPNETGLLGIVDIYVLWAIRKLHRDQFGWWPGPQVGACAHYRLNEFESREECGCGSTLRYGNCHMPLDVLTNRELAISEFRRLYECDYKDREPPKCVVDAARSCWNSMPSMAAAFSDRRDPSGNILI